MVTDANRLALTKPSRACSTTPATFSPTCLRMATSRLCWLLKVLSLIDLTSRFFYLPMIGSSRCQYPGIDKTKLRRTLFDNASNLLTNFLAGGNFKDMPVVKDTSAT